MAVSLQADIKCGFLRSLARNATRTVVSLREALEAFQDQGFSGLSSGRFIVSSSGAGHSVAFDAPAIGKQFAEGQVFALSEQLLKIYDSALLTLNIPFDPAGASDSQILTTMLADERLQSITDFQQDYTAMRFPTYGPTR